MDEKKKQHSRIDGTKKSTTLEVEHELTRRLSTTNPAKKKKKASTT